MKNQFINMITIIEKMENEEYDLTNSDGDDKVNSHFQFEEIDWFQGVHQITGVLPNNFFMFNQTLEKRIKEGFS